jgi:hypothetical protein
MTAARRSPLAAVRAFAFMSAQTSRRSPAQILIFFAMPVFVMAFVGLALRGYTTPQLIVGMLGTPGSAAAQRLADALDADPHLRVRAYEDVEPMRIAVFRGRLHAGIRVPEGWSASQDLEVWVSKAGAGSATLRAILDQHFGDRARPGRDDRGHPLVRHDCARNRLDPRIGGQRQKGNRDDQTAKDEIADRLPGQRHGNRDRAR